MSFNNSAPRLYTQQQFSEAFGTGAYFLNMSLRCRPDATFLFLVPLYHRKVL